MTVIPIRASPRTCTECKHFIFVAADNEGVASQCDLWSEFIDDESQGADCPDYEPDPFTP